MKIATDNIGIGASKKSFETLLKMITDQVQTIEVQICVKPFIKQTNIKKERQVI